MNRKYECIEIFEVPCKKIYEQYNSNFSSAKQTHVVQKHKKISWPLFLFTKVIAKRILSIQTDKFTTGRLRKFLEWDHHATEIFPTTKKKKYQNRSILRKKYRWTNIKKIYIYWRIVLTLLLWKIGWKNRFMSWIIYLINNFTSLLFR